MRCSHVLSVLACLLGTISADYLGVPSGPDDPLITFVNAGTTTHVYDVVKDSTAAPASYKGCTGCIKVPPGHTIELHPGVKWNGAITSQPGQMRYEINFNGTAQNPNMYFYDISLQYGLGDATVGPSDNSSPIAGEQDYLAKANAGWKHIANDPDKQRALLATNYLVGKVGGALTSVKNDMQAPYDVIYFLQVTALFNGYIGTGSVAGLAPNPTTGLADKKSTSTFSKKMTITGYH